jgi:hypothetical protein
MNLCYYFIFNHWLFKFRHYSDIVILFVTAFVDEKNILGNVKGGKSLLFEFSTLQQATDNFSDLNKLGEGGFGPVYKVLLFVLIIISLKSQHYY